MQKRVFYVILALCIGCICSSAARAKVWALPDYQESFSNRKNDGISHEPNNPGSLSCSDYGGFSSSTLKSGHVCEGSFYIGGQLCCTSSSCSNDYQYTASDCTKNGKIGGGQTCSDGGTTYYTYCKCDTSVYPYSSSECVPSLSGASCTDDDGTHYETCGKDPCAGKVTVTCAKALGCAETCGGNCIRCNPQPNCDPGYHWDDNWGCVENACGEKHATTTANCGSTNPSNSHWELGGSNGVQSGDSYCYECTVVCDKGYEFENNNKERCVASACPSGSKTTAADCGTISNGVYKLGSAITGYSGSASCKTCEVECNDGYNKVVDASGTVCELAEEQVCPVGYAIEAAGCGSANGGSYSLGSTINGYVGSQPCKQCILTCNSGFAKTAAECGTPPSHAYWYWPYQSTGACYQCQSACESGFTPTSSCVDHVCTTKCLPVEGVCAYRAKELGLSVSGNHKFVTGSCSCYAPTVGSMCNFNNAQSGCILLQTTFDGETYNCGFEAPLTLQQNCYNRVSLAARTLESMRSISGNAINYHLETYGGGALTGNLCW